MTKERVRENGLKSSTIPSRQRSKPFVEAVQEDKIKPKLKLRSSRASVRVPCLGYDRA